MTQHMLKCHTEYFEAIKNGTKTFECRYNDRNYQVGDELLLREYDPELGYTIRCIVRKIVYILPDFIGLIQRLTLDILNIDKAIKVLSFLCLYSYVRVDFVVLGEGR